VIRVDVSTQDVRDLVKKREQDLVEALAAAGQPDHRVAVDVHRASVDLGARERVDEHEPYTCFCEAVGQVRRRLRDADSRHQGHPTEEVALYIAMFSSLQTEAVLGEKARRLIAKARAAL